MENVFKGHNAFKSRFILTNHSDAPLPNKGWTFYYNFIRTPVPDEMVRKVDPSSVQDKVKISHVNGDLYKMTPTPDFPTLAKGQSVSIAFICSNWAINYTDAPAGGYFVFEDNGYKRTDKRTDKKYKRGQARKPAILGKPEPVKEIKVKPFVHERQTRRNANDNMPVETAEIRYKKNALLSHKVEETSPAILPTPVKMETHGGTLTLTGEFEIVFENGLEKEAAFLNVTLKQALGKELKTARTRGGAKGNKAILLSLDSSIDNREGYKLEIDESIGIIIRGGGDAGVFYGIQSLRALMPLETLAGPQTQITMPAILIEDQPRFPYRGMHLDVARNFQSKETVKKLLDLMAFYKLNKFHFHITDDEGWRLEIPGLPELTQVGAFRGHVARDITGERDGERDCLEPSFGSGPDKDPARSYGSGYYTRAEFIEILRYAHERKIEVIPEIDVPGHARAAVKAMDARYRRLMKEGKKEAAEEFLLRDFNDESVYKSVQGWTDNTLCVCRESVYRFLEKVTDEVIAMYREAGAHLTTIHTGGDEVPGGVWEKSPLCADFIAQRKDLENIKDLPAYFIRRFNNILQSRNLVTAGWQEIALSHGGHGQRAEPNPEFTGSRFLPYVWNNVWGWGMEDVGQRLANAGYPVVIAYVTNLYFDLAYAKDPAEPGYYWGGFIDTRKAWELTPLDIRQCAEMDLLGNPLDKEKFFKGVTPLTEKGRANIMGIQGLLWAENAKGRDMMEYLIFPKLLGLAERVWAKQPLWATIKDGNERKKGMNRAWNEFAHLLGKQELPRLDRLFGGVNYRIPPPGATIENGTLKANSAFPGLTIRYTLDGSEPSPQSPRYENPVTIGKDFSVIKLKVFNSKGRASRLAEISLR